MNQLSLEINVEFTFEQKLRKNPYFEKKLPPYFSEFGKNQFFDNITSTLFCSFKLK
jgi:hypothetical protein